MLTPLHTPAAECLTRYDCTNTSANSGSGLESSSLVATHDRVSPYAGRRLRGLVLRTYVRGALAFSSESGDGEGVTPRGRVLLRDVTELGKSQ